MRIPPSEHFTPVRLDAHFNVDRQRLDGGLGPTPGDDWSVTEAFGRQVYRGVPFDLGQPGQANALLVADEMVRIPIEPRTATYLIFLHAVDDAPPVSLPDFGEIGPLPGGGRAVGNTLGEHCADYLLDYDDGSEASTPIYRRFAIQQRHIAWAASPFAAMPALGPCVASSADEDYLLERRARRAWGDGETRHDSGRTSMPHETMLWLYALPNPRPNQPIRAIRLVPGRERVLVYAISTTTLSEHPLRDQVRQKARLTVPEGVRLNALGEIDTDDRDPAISVDLGKVISARAALEYDEARWLSGEPDVQPVRREDAVIVEYVAHPAARLYVATGPDAVIAADGPALRVEPVAAAERPVRIRIVDGATGQPVAARLHLHGAAGEYLPPRGYHRKVNPFWFEDNYAEFVNEHNQYCYVAGECVADLPLGKVFVEIRRGYEVAPVRTAVEVTPATEEVTFALERRLPWRERGWVTADTHVHFLSPQTALLEGAAEGVNVVNLLASQWGEMFSNVGDFDGRTVLGARDFGGDGEFLVRVGTENRMQVLGHISLLGYVGPMILPLCTGGPDESALGDPLEVSMAEWAERCLAQGGLVVMPHAPNPQAERAADIVLGLVDAIELMTFNPHEAQISPYGLVDWYRYQNLGYQLPLVGGSDKMAASSLLGGVRTYAQLGERDFTYDAWMAAVRDGNTFATVGPLVELSVDGRAPGGRVDLPAGGGTVDVAWRVESVSLPIEQVEIVAGGLVAEQVTVGGGLQAGGSASLRIDGSTWIALRVRGSYRGRRGDVAAHTSAVQVIVAGAPIFSAPDAVAVIEQIEGALAYVDTLAPRPEERRFKQVRASIAAAHNRLHERLHRHGIDHRHHSLHAPEIEREH